MALYDLQDDRPITGGEKNSPFYAWILSAGPSSAPTDLKVAGLTISERQRRQLESLGARDIREGGTPDLRRNDPVLVIEAGLIADERLIAAFIAEAQSSATRQALIAIGPDGERGGLAWLPGPDRPMDWQAIVSEAQPVDLSRTATYSPERRRHVPWVWMRPRDAASAREAAETLLSAAQKGCLDWPARFIHPPFENAAVRLLWRTPITPNMISLLAFLLGLYAAWCFARGDLWTGLLLALVVGPIDGVDGKLARSRVEFSRWGDLEHVGDKIVEYAWFAGIAAALGTGTAWATAALIIVAALAEALQGEFFRRVTGTQLDDAGQFERRYRVVSGRRNTFVWSMLPFAFLEMWTAGLIMVAAYAVLNFFVMQVRFFVRMAEFGRAHSAQIAKNLDASAYFHRAAEKSGEESSFVIAGQASALPAAKRLEVS